MQAVGLTGIIGLFEREKLHRFNLKADAQLDVIRLRRDIEVRHDGGFACAGKG